MKDITPEMVQHFVSSSQASPKTTANICITLQSLWRTAKAWGYVNSDVMSGVVLPSQKRVQRFFLSEREIHRIISAADEPYKTFYGLLAETGLRVGELCGLTVDDIDLGSYAHGKEQREVTRHVRIGAKLEATEKNRHEAERWLKHRLKELAAGGVRRSAIYRTSARADYSERTT